eukprot:scaffold336_cov250-Pinguiococcus_pyrenoidosus.AAC.16
MGPQEDLDYGRDLHDALAKGLVEPLHESDSRIAGGLPLGFPFRRSRCCRAPKSALFGVLKEAVQ